MQLGDVVTAQHGLAEVEQAVAEGEAALDERVPRLPTAHAVDAQTARLLERPHRPFGGGAETACLVRGEVVTERTEALLEVADRLAGQPDPQRRCVQAMNSARSWSS